MSGGSDALAWRPLGAVRGDRLHRARLATHWAVQVLWAAGNALADRREDDSHTSFTWDPAEELFLQGKTRSGIRVAVSPGRGTVHVLRGGGETAATIGTAGRTLREVLAAAQEAVVREVGPGPELRAPDYDLPVHPVGDGDPFAPPDAEAARELGAWFHDARLVAETVRDAHAGASPVRVWPHHFDLATLVALDPPGTPAEEARSVNVGLSPGDAGIPDPYFYVTPWPPPEGSAPAAPASGRWHTEGWFGAVLEAERITDVREAAGQRQRVEAFLGAAIPASRALLARKGGGA